MSVNSHPSSSATPRKVPVQQRSARTVALILDAGARIFEERGYSGATTNHVAEAAGVSIGSLYQYFPNKDALLVGLESRHLDHAAAELAHLADRWRSDEPDPQQWALTFVSALVVLNDTPLHLLIYDLAPGLPELRTRAAKPCSSSSDRSGPNVDVPAGPPRRVRDLPSTLVARRSFRRWRRRWVRSPGDQNGQRVLGWRPRVPAGGRGAGALPSRSSAP